MDFIVTIRFKETTIEHEVEADYSIDAINMSIDDWSYEMLNNKGSMSITCKVKGE